WLKKELERRGAKVYVPALPNTKNPRVAEQVEFVLKSVPFDKDTVLLGHSLGAIVALKVLERLKQPVRRSILVAGFIENDFLDHDRFDEQTFNWKFDAKRIRINAGNLHILRDTTDEIVPSDQARKLQNLFGGIVIEFAAQESHVCGKQELEVLRSCIDSIRVFTTRPDTLFGATYMVLGPEHELVKSLKLQVKNYEEVEAYVKKAKAKSDEERIAEGKEKTGVELKGIKAINPANKEEIPVFVADYVLGNVGTGAIMAVPAHDKRDFDFAKKFNLPIKIVICPHWPEKTCPLLDTAYTGEGHLVDSGAFDGTPSKEARKKISDFVGGVWKIQYRLRDWLISRQRYWGPPIPMIFCEHCRNKNKGERKDMSGWYAVEEKNLPVKLPFIKNFRPTGTDQSPLAHVEKFYNVRCPKCGLSARRETDVSDTFLDSSWYYLRYPSVRDKKNPWNPNITKKWFPVDMYIGGTEHSVLHLLYARFLAHVFKDWKMTYASEPFVKFRSHGLITKDGAKMSKSKGNIVNPDEYINAYGADTMRMYLAFMAPLDQGGDFRDAGIIGITRFLNRVWNFASGHAHGVSFKKGMPHTQERNEFMCLLHKTIKKVGDDIEGLQHNTAISSLMILLNECEAKTHLVAHDDITVFLKLLAPFAPHITEELWQTLGFSASKKFVSIHREPWPSYEKKWLREEVKEFAVQINGKFCTTFVVPVGVTEQEAVRLTFLQEKVKKVLSGRTPSKTIFVPGKLVNIVV
ncbi:MAG: leucine--tRNA ligase, partial [bacterium]|nr:leucine--tRNA ligase [bacterium]